MQRIVLCVALALAIMVACDQPAIEGNPTGDDESPSVELPEFEELVADDMQGEKEKPPGDPDATGSMDLSINVEGGEVCIGYEHNIQEKVTEMHVHEGAAGASGDAVVELPVKGGCVESDPDLLQDIVADPESYYVNMHTKKYPDGAIRDQLSAK